MISFDTSLTVMASRWVSNTIQRIIDDLANYGGGRQLEDDTIDVYQLQLDLVYRELIGMEALGDLNGTQTLAFDLIRQALVIFHHLVEENHDSGHTCFHAPLIYNQQRGRPRYDIPRNQLAHLLEIRFSVPQISGILRVSVSTLRRRMSLYGLSIQGLYSSISDQELEGVVREIQHQFPTCGNRQMQGHLHSRGIRVHQFRVREM